MAKLKTDQIGTADFVEYLDAHSDFSFELSVLKMLRQHGISCEHGGHYEDPVTGKSREFDIRAIKTIRVLRVRMAVECKNIRENFPILISCIPRHEAESFHEIVLVGEPKPDSGPFGMALPVVMQSRATTLRIQGVHSLYKPNEPVGKSTVQVGRALDGTISATDAELYEKWGQSLASATDLVSRAYWDGEDGQKYWSTILSFVVVPNNRLWTVTYDLDGNRVSDPLPSSHCSCFVGKTYEMGSKVAGTQLILSHVNIVTFDGLRAFVSDQLETEEGMTKIFPKEGVLDAFERLKKA